MEHRELKYSMLGIALLLYGVVLAARAFWGILHFELSFWLCLQAISFLYLGYLLVTSYSLEDSVGNNEDAFEIPDRIAVPKGQENETLLFYRVNPQMKVAWKGKVGVTSTDYQGVCKTDETPVLFGKDGETTPVKTGELKLLGPQMVKADPDKCGFDTKRECGFLRYAEGHWVCSRYLVDFGGRYNIYRAGTDDARFPKVAYPYCQLPVLVRTPESGGE